MLYLMWMQPLALALGALLLAVALPAFALPLVLVSGAAFVWAFAIGVLPRLRRRDAYDLSELKRVHEEEEMRALDPEGALGLPEKVVCPRCFTEYPHRVRACPRCGHGS